MIVARIATGDAAGPDLSVFGTPGTWLGRYALQWKGNNYEKMVDLP
jgi:hypothetical protein